MRLKPSICALIVVCWALTSAYATHAQEIQEGRMPAPSEELNGGDPDPEKNSKSANGITAGGLGKDVVRDSTQSVSHGQSKLVKPFKIIEKHEKEEEDPLSFNFLYYIIEKFKLSDIVE